MAKLLQTMHVLLEYLHYRKYRVSLYFMPFLLMLLIVIVCTSEEKILVVPQSNKVFKIQPKNEEAVDIGFESQIYDYISSTVTQSNSSKNQVCYVQISGFESSSEANSVFKNVFAKELDGKVLGHTIGRIGGEFYIRVGPIKHDEVEEVCKSLFRNSLCRVLCF